MNNYIIAFDLGGSALKYGYGTIGADLQPELLYFHSKPHKEKSLAGLKSLFAEALSDIAAMSPPPTPPEPPLPPLAKGGRAVGGAQLPSPSCIAIASPGIIDSDTGTILGSTPNLPFIKDINLCELLSDISNLPVYIENDANLMTLAEASTPPPASRDRIYSVSTLGITIGTGIGTGYVLDQQILHGSAYKAMEAGHIIVVPDGRPCLCGKRGCFEAYCSAESMKRIVYEQHPQMKDLTINKILASTDPDVQQTLRKVLDIFAIALSNLVMVLNPSEIVIGGGVIEIPEFDFEYLREQTYHNLTAEFKDFSIKKARYENKAGVIGGIIYGHQKSERYAVGGMR